MMRHHSQAVILAATLLLSSAVPAFCGSMVGEDTPTEAEMQSLPDAIRGMGAFLPLFFTAVLMAIAGTMWFTTRLTRLRRAKQRHAGELQQSRAEPTLEPARGAAPEEADARVGIQE